MRILVAASVVLALLVGPPVAAEEKVTEPAGSKAAAGPQAKATWPEGPGYMGSVCTFDWVDISTTGTEIQLCDDCSEGPLDLGFPFRLYGAEFEQTHVSSNGYLSFTGGSAWNPNYCPMLGIDGPRYLVAPLWDDLDPGDTMDPIYYQAFDVCPIGTGRCFVAQWQDICHYPGGPDCQPGGTFEAILYEDGRVVLQILDPGELAGGSSTTGISGESFAADHWLTYACDTPDSLTADLCLEFAPTFGLFTYVAGGIAHVDGSQGTSWRSSYSVANLSGMDTDIELSWVGASSKMTVRETVANGQIREWDDITTTLFNLGDGVAGSVTLLADTPVTVTVRTYNQSPEGTFGQHLPGLRPSQGLPPGAVGLLPNLKSTTGFRTNVGVVNLSHVACPVRVQLYDSSGSPLGSTFQIDAGPFGWSQVNRVLRDHGVHDIAYATVELVNADCQSWVYASVVDENTGDPTTIPVHWGD